MIGALWTGITGLSGAQRALDNESNNIANVNTIGYKSSRIAFSDQIYQDNIGKGVSTFDVEKLYTQGNLKVTGVDYDMALSGDGFFQVSDGNEVYYSRAGNFRMGQNGTLQNAGGYAIQGWAMAPLQPDTDVTATDSNATKITNDYNKLLGNVIIRNTQSIDTIVAKATDYTETARSDVNSIFTGAGYKTAATKISDVELLITEYNTQLNKYADANPKPTATDSSEQVDLLDYDLDNAVLDQGDEMYVYIDGTKYSQSFDTDEATTIKKLIDKLSNIAGMNAYLTDGQKPDTTAGDPSEPTPRVNTSTDVGQIVVKSLIPGQQFRITEFGWTDASNANQATKGTVQNLEQAKMGTGMGAIKSVETALAMAVSGKQEDIYTVKGEMGNLYGNTNSDLTDKEYKYQVDIYDKELKKIITVPSTPLSIKYPDEIKDFANAINIDDSLSKYLNAYIINGSLKVEPKSSNFDVEFTTNLVLDAFPSIRNIDMAKGEIQLLEFTDDTPSGDETFTLTVDIGNDTKDVTVDIEEGDTKETIARKAKDAIEDDSDIHVDIIDNKDGTLSIKYDIAYGDVDDVTIDDEDDTTLSVKTVREYSSAETSNVAVSDTFNVNSAPNPDNTKDYTMVFTTDATADDPNEMTISITDPADIDAIVAAINTENEEDHSGDTPKGSGTNVGLIAENVDGKLVVWPSKDDGDGNPIKDDSIGTDDFRTKLTVDKDGDGNSDAVPISKSALYSGVSGAGGEFISMTTSINQTAVKDDIQLRLDSLELTDSAFGEFSVDETGLITMKQDGADFAVGQVAVARFTDNRGLDPAGNNLLKATNRSGNAIFNIDNDKTALIKGGTLELSTADLSESLVNLMVFQRAFEANSKSISTADQILTTLIQLKK